MVELSEQARVVPQTVVHLFEQTFGQGDCHIHDVRDTIGPSVKEDNCSSCQQIELLDEEVQEEQRVLKPLLVGKSPKWSYFGCQYREETSCPLNDDDWLVIPFLGVGGKALVRRLPGVRSATFLLEFLSASDDRENERHTRRPVLVDVFSRGKKAPQISHGPNEDPKMCVVNERIPVADHISDPSEDNFFPTVGGHVLEEVTLGTLELHVVVVGKMPLVRSFGDLVVLIRFGEKDVLLLVLLFLLI